MAKIDLKKEWKHLYKPSKKAVSLVEVPPLNYLMIDGEGNPNTAQAYQDAIATLYPVAYALKFMLKEGGQDYVVMPLEGLWWTEDMSQFSLDDKDAWQWTAMILQPEPVTAAMVEEASRQAQQKKDLPALAKLRFAELTEGLSAQIMHIGPYAAEAPTIEKLHAFIAENHYQRRGKHHEIYLSDPRRAKPENIKTIIRQPIR